MNDEFEDIRAAVMAGRVEFHVAQGDLIHIEVGVDDGFFIPNGLGDVMAAGIDDAAAAAAGGGIQFVDGARFH